MYSKTDLFQHSRKIQAFIYSNSRPYVLAKPTHQNRIKMSVLGLRFDSVLQLTTRSRLAFLCQTSLRYTNSKCISHYLYLLSCWLALQLRISNSTLFTVVLSRLLITEIA